VSFAFEAKIDMDSGVRRNDAKVKIFREIRARYRARRGAVARL